MRSNELRIFLRQKTAVYSQCLGEEVRHFSDREESQFITAQLKKEQMNDCEQLLTQSHGHSLNKDAGLFQTCVFNRLFRHCMYFDHFR